MIKKIFALLSAAFSYFCIATVIAIAAAVTALWAKGALDQNRMYRVLGALHGLDIITIQKQLANEESEVDQEQPSHAVQLEKQTMRNLDLDLREDAIGNATADMNSIRSKLEIDQARFEELKLAYATKLQEFADEEQANSIKELQRTLEAIKPAQAKEQLSKMIDDDAMDAVVTIVKSMAIDKRKKIIAEFKVGQDSEELYDILKNIRLGEPIASQIRDTQNKLGDVGDGL